MTKKETTQLDRLEAKVDLIYSLIANDLQAKQALQVNGAMKAQLEKEPEHEQAKAYEKKAYESFVFHSEGVNHGIDFFARVFGEDAQNRYNKLLEENPKENVNENSNEDSKLQEAAKMAEDALKEIKEKNEKEGNA